MKTLELSNLTRSIDFRYPTNRWIVIVSLIVLMLSSGFSLFSTADFPNSLSLGFQLGMATFLAWVLAREVDPDHKYSAFVAVGFALVGLLYWGEINLSHVFWLILALRIVNRSVGLPITHIDAISMTGFSIWLAHSSSWIFAIFAALVFFLDSQLPKPNTYSLQYSIGSLSFGVVSIFFLKNYQFLSLPLGIAAPLLAISFLFYLFITQSKTVKSVGDKTGKPLKLSRVRAAQAVMFLFTIVMSFSNYFLESFLLWGVMIGVIAYRCILFFRSKL